MRYFASTAALLAALSTAALAQSVYTGTRTVGNLTANVTLTTDGNTGALTAADILGFTVNFSDGTSIAGTSSNVSTQGDALIASTNQIGFNFDFPSESTARTSHWWVKTPRCRTLCTACRYSSRAE